MAKAKMKTTPTKQSPDQFVAALEHPTRRADAGHLLDFFADVTGWQARMWGASIIGYGRYEYKYESGREGEFMVTGFSPRKASLVFYIMPGYRDLGDQLSRLGKHKLGKSCLYVNKLADIDETVLREIVVAGVDYMKANYPVFSQ